MMLQPSCLVFFITLWFSLEIACKASMTTPECKFFPLPTNLKTHLYPGIINVTWDCNITKSMEEHTYQIEFQRNTVENISISKCFHEHYVTDHFDFTLSKGMELNISSGSEWKFEKVIPEGNSNTAAENLDFKVYNVSIVNCSWTVGREAPKDTQYTLAFRETLYEKQNRVYVPCKDYRTDSFGRQVGCVLKAQNISFNVSIYVQLVGSSNETSIQFFDEKIKLNDFVILDPPRNIHMNFSSTELEITWETPETYHNVGNHCFLYSVKINGDIKDEVKGYSYKTSNLQLNEKVTVFVRAKWEDFCSKNISWSRWSDPHIKEPESASFTPNHLLLVLGIITFAVLLLLMFLCHRFRVWKRLFPQIPKPAKKIFESIEQKELLKIPMKFFKKKRKKRWEKVEHRLNLLRQSHQLHTILLPIVLDLLIKVIAHTFQEQIIKKKTLPEEDEECICLQVTEIPQNEQPQYVNIGIHQDYSNIY